MHQSVPLVCKRFWNFLKETALARAQARVIFQSFTHTLKRRVPSFLWVLRIKHAEQQVAVDLRGIFNAQERPPVVMK